MAVTFDSISGAEPSTVTFKVQTVTIDQNSTTVHREILVFGDPETSNAVARVVAAAPDSTHFGAVVRQVGYSTVVSVSTGSVRVHQSSAADLNVTVAGYSTVASISTGSVRVHQSSAADLNVTVAGYSTVVSVSTGSVRVHQSTAADLNVTVAGYSTVVSVSTGSVRVHQSTAADLNVTVAGYSTTANISSVAGTVAVMAAASTTAFGNVGLIHTYGAKTTITITSTGLANGSARESAFIDNSTTRYRDVQIHVQRKGSTASSGVTDFYVYASLGDTSYTDLATGADAAFTSTNRRQSRFLGALQMSTLPAVVRAHFLLSDVFATIPQRWGLIEINNSGGAHGSTAADFVTEYQGLY